MNWISVDDGLPERDHRDYSEDVLAYRHNQQREYRVVYYDYKYSGWYEELEVGAGLVDGVTHWMPLPKPPIAEQDQ